MGSSLLDRVPASDTVTHPAAVAQRPGGLSAPGRNSRISVVISADGAWRRRSDFQ